MRCDTQWVMWHIYSRCDIINTVCVISSYSGFDYTDTELEGVMSDIAVVLS